MWSSVWGGQPSKSAHDESSGSHLVGGALLADPMGTPPLFERAESGLSSGEGRPSVHSENWTEIHWAQDWEEEARRALAEVRGGMALITDSLGVEVRLFDHSGRAPSPDRFPLRILCHSSGGFRKNSFHTSSTRSGSKESGSKERHAGREERSSTQVSELIAFSDVWPGIIEAKMRDLGAIADGFMVITDTTGVELDLDAHRDQVPSADRFPLKVHFRTKRVGPQNVASQASGAQTGGHELKKAASASSVDRCASKTGMLGGQSQGVWGRRTDGVDPASEHSIEVPLAAVLPGVVDEKLRRVGLALDEQSRSIMLITDCTGVIVKPKDGIPDRSTFPLKVHIESAALVQDIEAAPSGWFWDHSRRRKPARSSTSDVSGSRHSSMVNSISCRLQTVGTGMRQTFSGIRKSRA